MVGPVAVRSVVLVFPGWDAVFAAAGEEEAHRAFDPVVRAVGDVSPLVEIEGTGTIVLAARGPSRYFGGDRALAEHLHGVVGGLDEVVRAGTGWGVGIAGSRFAATAAAHLAWSRSTPCVVEDPATLEFVSALPVSALSRIAGIDADVVDLFGRLGLSTCAAVRGLGEAALIDRFGAEGRRVHELVTGSDVRFFDPGAVSADLSRAVEFDTGLFDAASVVAAARPTIESLVAAVSSRNRQCVRLLLGCEADHGEQSRRIWSDTRGFTVAGIASRLAVQLEGWLTSSSDDPASPTSAVVRVEVAAIECRDHLAVQPLLWGGQRENIERAARAAAMASAVAPCVEVTVPRWEGGRDPAHAYARVPLGHVDISDDEASRARVERGEGAARDWSGSVPRPFPAWVPARPRPGELLADGVAVGVTGRHELDAEPTTLRVGLRTYEVLRRAGPWPVEERWWDPRRRRRHVRLQLLVRDERGATGVVLVGLENSTWHLLARHD